MKRSTLNYVVDLALALSFMLSFVTGLLKFPGLSRILGLHQRVLPYYEITLIHDWNGLFLGLLVIAHILLHLSWWTATMRKLLGVGR